VQLYTTDYNAEAGSRTLTIRDERGSIHEIGSVAGPIAAWRMTASGCTMQLLSYPGGGGTLDVTTNHQLRFIRYGTVVLAFSTSNAVDLYFTTVSAIRTLVLGAVDSGGAGYRMVRAAN
jgi:hypothetical protein